MKTNALAERLEPADVEISDIDRAALLLEKGCRLQDVVPSNKPGRLLFVIRGPRLHIHKVLEGWDHRDIDVNAANFAGLQRQLRSRLLNEVHFRGSTNDAA